MKKVILSAGPIPAKLDSVKIITNKFKGGLMIKTAEELARSNDLEVEIVKWVGTSVKFQDEKSSEKITVINITDLYDYRNYMRETEADAYVLGGAVANLIPLNPWSGKFQSHNFKVGDELYVRFTIAPRIIDEIKTYHPRSTLVGYKLFDGSEAKLIEAGWETLCGSRANVVFCNHPAKAKSEKIAVMPDGTTTRMNFAEHIDFIQRVISLEWYQSKVVEDEVINPHEQDLDEILGVIGQSCPPYLFGTVAVRDDNGFITTTRGKRGKQPYCKVYQVDHTDRTVVASQKATMNAPFIERLFNMYPECKWILHGHRQISGNVYPYCFSGTIEETELAEKIRVSEKIFNVENHGNYAAFENLRSVKEWLNDNY